MAEKNVLCEPSTRTFNEQLGPEQRAAPSKCSTRRA